MFKFASQQKQKTISVIAICLLAVFSVTVSRWYKKTQIQPVVAPQKLLGETNEQRIAFLKENGIKTESEPFYIADIIIPASFDGVYEKFETVQNAQGFSLLEYKGKKVRRFSYNVIKSPKNMGRASAEILVSDGKIIACALCSFTNDGGFFKIIG